MFLGDPIFKYFKVVYIECTVGNVSIKLMKRATFEQWFHVMLQLEEIRASERNLRIRVKSLTNELALYKRYSHFLFTNTKAYKDIHSTR